MSSRRLTWATSFWLALLILLSLTHASLKRQFRTLNTNPNRSEGSLNHRAYHFVAFGITAAMLYRLARLNRAGRATPLVLAFAATAVLGVSLEYAQHHFYHTAFETWDVRDDAIAALAGALAAAVFPALPPRSPNSPE